MVTQTHDEQLFEELRQEWEAALERDGLREQIAEAFAVELANALDAARHGQFFRDAVTGEYISASRVQAIEFDSGL